MALVGDCKRSIVTGRAGAIALAMASGVLSGCQSVQGTSPQTMVRVVDASCSAKAVDVTLAGTLIAYDTSAPSVTNYAFLPPENATASIFPTGTKKADNSVAGSFEVAQQHSILLTDSGGGIAATVLNDQNTPAGDVAIRFLQEASGTGAIDVYFVPTGTSLSDAKPLLSNAAAGSETDYFAIPAGTYTVVLTPAGSKRTQAAGTSLALTAGQVRTILVVDSQLTTNPPVNLVIGNDLN
jgi:hypothetical protein